MKRLAVFFLLAIGTFVSAQENQNKDEILKSYFVGSWTHIQSTFPSGNVTKYYQEFDFNQDGTGTCFRIENGDTVAISIRWSISDGKVFLYTVLQDGRIVHGDTIYLSHLDNERFFGDKVYGPMDLRKTCLYKKKEGLVV